MKAVSKLHSKVAIFDTCALCSFKSGDDLHPNHIPHTSWPRTGREAFVFSSDGLDLGHRV